jgi:hypothetical protein
LVGLKLSEIGRELHFQLQEMVALMKI